MPAACPICQGPANHDHRPFCSRRCADLDLGRWLTGAYKLPMADDEAELEDPPQTRPQ